MSTTVSGPPRLGRPPSRWARFRSSPHRTRWINAGLAVLLLGTAVGAYLLIGNPSPPQQVERTAEVTRGTVTASVSGSGNAASQASTPVSFESTGVVKEVDVKPGDTVTLGQVLATIDPDSAQASLRTAQAQLDGAKAALAQAQSGATPVQAQQDALAITSAQQALDTAQKQLDQAHQQKDLDDKSTADAVSAAQRKQRIDEQAPCPTTSAEPAPDQSAQDAGSSGLLSSPKKSSGNSTSCNSKDATLAADRAAVTTAQNNQRNTALADEKAITSAEAAVTTAKNNVTSAKLAQQANQHPQTPAQIAQVQATVDSAQVAVDTASRGVDDTTLKAPQAGVVLAVNGKVGESSGGSSSSTTSSTGTTATGGTSSSASSASSSASSAGSGFVVIANVSQLAITANIAEADASKIKLGQPAQITFPGTGTTATGSVVQITPQSTVTNNVVLYPITIAVDSAPPDVGVGATASLSIRTSAKDSVLRVPTAAITTQGDRHTVTVRRDGADSQVPVQLGIQGDTDTEVLSGLAEGDTVVLPSTTGGGPASNGIPGAPARTGG